jgi:hypothetical protein
MSRFSRCQGRDPRERRNLHHASGPGTVPSSRGYLIGRAVPGARTTARGGVLAPHESDQRAGNVAILAYLCQRLK